MVLELLFLAFLKIDRLTRNRKLELLVSFMKKNYLALSLLAAATLMVTACGGDDKKAAVAATAPAATTTSISKDSPFEAKSSYAIGASVGTYIATVEKDQADILGKFDHELVVKGFMEALEGKIALDQKDMTDTLAALDTKLREGMEKKMQAEADNNLAAGKKFLAENAKKDGVKTTASGLQYKILAEGSGKVPTDSDTVSVRYKGTTIDGQVFDEQKDPIDLPLANIIPGWTEGLKLMKEGGKAQLFIPADLAYGEMGAGDIIKPNSTLIFDIELVKVSSPAVKAEPKK